MKTPAPSVEEEKEVAQPTRRAFLQGSGLAAGAAVVGGTTLATLAAHRGVDQDTHQFLRLSELRSARVRANAQQVSS